MTRRIVDVLRSIRPSTWLLVAVLAVSCSGLWALYPLTISTRNNSGHDFKLLYSAAQMMRAHQNPYDGAAFFYRAVANGIPAALLGSAHLMEQPYVYPPLFAQALIPLTFLSVHSALTVWRVLSLVFVFMGTFGLLSLWKSGPGAAFVVVRANRVLLSALVALSPLSLYAVYWGNPVVLVYAAMGGWIWALHRNQFRFDIVAGVLMTGALLKPQLAVPLAGIAVFTVVQGRDAWGRRLRVALGFGGAFVVLAAFDVLLTGASLLPAWKQSVTSLSQMVFYQPDQPTLVGMVQPQLDHHAAQTQRIILFGIAFAGVAIGLILYLWLRRRWSVGPLLALLTLVWCFASPYSHANDEVFYVPAGLAALGALAALCEPLVAGFAPRIQKLRLRTFARVGVQIAVTLSALVVLWLGGAIQQRYGVRVLQFPYAPGRVMHLRLAAAIVPLALLAAFLVDWRLHRRGEGAGAREEERTLTAEWDATIARVSQR